MSSRSFDDRYRFQLREQKHVCVIMVNGEKQLMPYDKYTRLQDIFDSVLKYCGICNGEIFGLALLIGDFYHFLELCTRVNRIKFRHGRTVVRNATDSLNESIPFGTACVHLRVKFYVGAHTLRERTVKNYYYQQLRENVINFNLPCFEETQLQLAALALQADFGPYNSTPTTEAYWKPQRYFPAWMVSRFGEEYLKEHVPRLHAEHGTMSRAEAVFRFIGLASVAGFNMHLCKLQERNADTRSDIWLGVSPSGLSLYQQRDADFRFHMNTLVWKQITRIHCEKKRFEIRVSDSRSIFLYTATSLQAEHLLWLCRSMHGFQRQAQLCAPLSSEDVEENERTAYRETYVYSDMADLQSATLAQWSHLSVKPRLPKSWALLHNDGRKTQSMDEQDLRRADLTHFLQSSKLAYSPPTQSDEVSSVTPIGAQQEESSTHDDDAADAAGGGGLRSWRSEAVHLQHAVEYSRTSSSSSCSSSSSTTSHHHSVHPNEQDYFHSTSSTVEDCLEGATSRTVAPIPVS